MKALPYALREARRLQAWKLRRQGWSQRAIANWLEVNEASVSRWLRRARLLGGTKGLRHRRAPGAARRLPRACWRQLRALLRRGAETHGFHGESWTRQRVAALIEREFAVVYSPRHVGRLLAAMNRSVQRPLRRARQRHEEKIARWRAEPLARPSSKAKAPGQSLFFVDERGFYPLPAVVRPYAPRGQTPILREWLTRDHLAVIAAVNAPGRVYCQVRARAFDAVAVTEFLRHLLRVVPGKLLVVWDGAPIHRSKVVKAFLQAEGGGRLELEALPGYAPDLNPLDTGVWHWLKNVALAHVCAQNMGELKRELHLAIKRLRRQPTVIKASFVEAKLA